MALGHATQSCRIVDIGIAISFFIAAGHGATAPRLVPAVGGPLVLADVLLGSTATGSRSGGPSAMLCATKGLSHRCLKL